MTTRFWYCVKHKRVETDENMCPPIDRLGPYDTQQEAEHALATAEERNEAWDEEDKEWNGD